MCILAYLYNHYSLPEHAHLWRGGNGRTNISLWCTVQPTDDSWQFLDPIPAQLKLRFSLSCFWEVLGQFVRTCDMLWRCWKQDREEWTWTKEHQLRLSVERDYIEKLVVANTWNFPGKEWNNIRDQCDNMKLVKELGVWGRRYVKQLSMVYRQEVRWKSVQVMNEKLILACLEEDWESVLLLSSYLYYENVGAKNFESLNMPLSAIFLSSISKYRTPSFEDIAQQEE